jgi:hypothetical protein
MNTHHGPCILADALDVLLVQKIIPKLCVIFRPSTATAATASTIDPHREVVTSTAVHGRRDRQRAKRATLETEREQEAPERKRQLDREAPLSLGPRKVKRVEVHTAEIVGIGTKLLAQTRYRAFHPFE